MPDDDRSLDRAVRDWDDRPQSLAALTNVEQQAGSDIVGAGA